MELKYVITLCGILGLPGCAGIVPQNVDEYRASSVVSEESYEVSTPYAKIESVLRTKAAECLDTSLVERVCSSGGGCSSRKWIYRPTIKSSDSMIQLAVQLEADPAHLVRLDRPPAGGNYIVVAEATPAGENKTSVRIYKRVFGFKVIPGAIKHWTNGTNLGCPNLAEDTHAP